MDRDRLDRASRKESVTFARAVLWRSTLDGRDIRLNMGMFDSVASARQKVERVVRKHNLFLCGEVEEGGFRHTFDSARRSWIVEWDE